MMLRSTSPLVLVLLLATFLPLALADSPARSDPVPAAPAATTTAVTDASTIPATTKPSARRVIAYYFHTTQRCATCRRIEQWSGEAILTAFGKELADSSLVFLPLNTDEKANAHFVDDFQLYTKALVVVETAGGKPGAWKNLQKVWEYTGDQEKFFAYVQDEIRAALTPKPKG